MFVKSNNCGAIHNNFLLNNKELPTGDISERFVYLTSQLFDNSKGNSAYTLIFDMSNENKCVTQDISVLVTPAQAAILNVLKGNELTVIINSLENIWVTSLFYSDPDLVNLSEHNEARVFINNLKEIEL